MPEKSAEYRLAPEAKRDLEAIDVDVRTASRQAALRRQCQTTRFRWRVLPTATPLVAKKRTSQTEKGGNLLGFKQINLYPNSMAKLLDVDFYLAE